ATSAFCRATSPTRRSSPPVSPSYGVEQPLFDAVERKIKDVEIAQRAGLGKIPVLPGERARENEGYLPLCEAAMRAQAMAGEPREVVLGTRRADRRVGVAEHDEVGLAVERQLEPPCRFRAVEDQGHPGQRCARR